MIIAIDAYYREDDTARVVGIVFDNWEDEKIRSIYQVEVADIEPYESGNFYKRELPCILELLKKVPLHNIHCIVVDGYVYLNDENKFGLGAYLYDALNKNIPIIGVAKHHFVNNNINVRELQRGISRNPLYITAIGLPLEEATSFIANMAGDFRMPTLLKTLDQETKK